MDRVDWGYVLMALIVLSIIVAVFIATRQRRSGARPAAFIDLVPPTRDDDRPV